MTTTSAQSRLRLHAASTEHRSFDELNRLTLLEDASSNDIAAWTRYGAANRRDVLSYESGTRTTWGWDGFRRPTTITHEDSGSSYLQGSPKAVCVALLRAPHGGSDNPAFEARSHQSGKGDTASPRSGTYDRANRLIKVLQDVDDPANEVANPGAESYADTVPVRSAKPQHGRRAGLTSLVTTPYGGSAATVSYSTNAMNEYTSVGGTSHSYDDNGNLVDDGTYEYVYDAHNHLIEVIDPAGPTTIATYTYDALGLGRRTSKTVGSDTTPFVYADQQCLEEYDGSGNLLRLFAFGQGIDEVAMMEAPDVADVDGDTNTTETKRFYYHTQLLGSVTQVTDPDEVVVESYDYGPYGEITIKDIGGSTVSTSQIGNPFTYTGRRLDEESGLYYYRARHYSAELKRFVQRDPLEYVDGANSLAYVRAQVISHLDPGGMWGYADAEEVAAWAVQTSVGDADRAKDIAAKATTDAFTWARKHKGGPRASNALRHCMWMCEMVRRIGVVNANKLASIHEARGATSYKGQNPGDREADEHNNEEGRRCARSRQSCRKCCIKKWIAGELATPAEMVARMGPLYLYAPDPWLDPKGGLHWIVSSGVSGGASACCGCGPGSPGGAPTPRSMYPLTQYASRDPSEASAVDQSTEIAVSRSVGPVHAQSARPPGGIMRSAQGSDDQFERETASRW